MERGDHDVDRLGLVDFKAMPDAMDPLSARIPSAFTGFLPMPFGVKVQGKETPVEPGAEEDPRGRRRFRRGVELTVVRRGA